MKNLVYFFIMIAFFSSCSNDENNATNNLYSLNRQLEFKVTTASGLDLLNPNTENSFSESDIKIYNLIHGEIVEVWNESSQYPRDFKIIAPEDSGIEEYFIRIYMNHPELEHAITYIAWNEVDMDTIKSNSVANGNSLVLTQAWYNNEALIDESTENLPVIIKDF